MKRALLVLLMVTAFANVGAAQSSHQRKTEYFVEEATKEFKLNRKKRKELLQIRQKYVKDFVGAGKEFRKGNITAEEKQKEFNRINTKFKEDFGRLTGKTQIELGVFMTWMRKELPRL
ncbi:hypothetical protein [uncultured Algibacter sp.]|uniref:hypothetical protein n=1 Tax=uncultured Algibacter sp. TaxID=298659 RepID=UPI0032165F81